MMVMVVNGIGNRAARVSYASAARGAPSFSRSARYP